VVKSTRIVSIGAAAIGTAFIVSGTAAATPSEGDSQRTELAKGTTNTPISIVTNGQETAFYVMNVVLQPGASSGWHTHSGPEESVVTKGTVFLQTATNCVPTAIAAGQTIFIPAEVPHRVRNEGPDAAEVVATYTLPADRMTRDDAPAACP
jgi:quercetin dioxygenase-like cupin family protein